MKTTKTSTGKLTILFLVLAFTLVACINGSILAAGKSITVPLIADPGTMNPINAASTAEVIMARVLFDGLTALHPDTFLPEPCIAESWETSDNGLVWTFYLRENVHWHDGEPLTADDVVFTFEKVLDPDTASVRRPDFLKITDIVKKSDHVVEFHLTEPWSAFPTYLANRMQIAPKHLLEGKDIKTYSAFNKFNPVGTGPFKMEIYDAANYILLTANDAYFDGAPEVDKLLFKIVPDANSQIAQLLTGELDFVLLEPTHMRAVENAPDIKIETGPKSRWWAFHLNNSHELFEDVRVRQAISHAIDKQTIIDNVFLGFATEGTGPLIPALEPYYNPDVKTYPFDPEKAKELLAEAGWKDTDGDGILDKDGKPFRFEISSIQGNSTIERSSIIIQQNLKDIGLDPYIRGYEFSSFIADVRDNREGPKMFNSYFCWMTPEPEPDGISSYFHSSAALSGSNFTVYRNARVDELLDKGGMIYDLAERTEIYHEIQEILAEEVARLFVTFPDELYAVRKNIEGVQVSNPWSYTHYLKIVN